MINLYQEQIPFSNKVLEKPVSTNGAFTNPVIMPFALDFTSYNNALETVMYIRNDAIDKYYKDIVICLMVRNGNDETPTTGQITYSPVYSNFSVNGNSSQATVAKVSSAQDPTGTVNLTNKYQAAYRIAAVDPNYTNINVKFSYGYNELSGAMWASKRPVLIIPSLGVQNAPNTQYIPIRMRLSWVTPPTMLTIRDYFIDVSYGSENNVVS